MGIGRRSNSCESLGGGGVRYTLTLALPSSRGLVFRCNKKWVEEHAGQGPMPYYTWEAEECFLDTVEKEKFCTVMAGRKGILFAGERRRESTSHGLIGSSCRLGVTPISKKRT